MRTTIMTLSLWMVVASGATLADQSSSCSFSVSRSSAAGEVVGSNDAANRASVMLQPDSPLVILNTDLSGMNLTTGEGVFSRTGQHVVTVKNVSDRVILDARLSVKVGFGRDSGVASGVKLGRSLQPGEQTRLEWRSGMGRGSTSDPSDVRVVALVEEVQLSGCTYRPSESWPARTSGS